MQLLISCLVSLVLFVASASSLFLCSLICMELSVSLELLMSPGFFNYTSIFVLLSRSQLSLFLSWFVIICCSCSLCLLSMFIEVFLFLVFLSFDLGGADRVLPIPAGSNLLRCRLCWLLACFFFSFFLCCVLLFLVLFWSFF